MGEDNGGLAGYLLAAARSEQARALDADSGCVRWRLVAAEGWQTLNCSMASRRSSSCVELPSRSSSRAPVDCFCESSEEKKDMVPRCASRAVGPGAEP